VRHGFRLPVREAVDHDLKAIAQFEPPRPTSARSSACTSSRRTAGPGSARRCSTA
jgi:hypothetical protein